MLPLCKWPGRGIMYIVRLKAYIVLVTVYTVLLIVYTLQFTVHSVQLMCSDHYPGTGSSLH